MSVQRNINSKFWSDTFVVEKLNPLDRYLFLYFLTNERTNLSGVYEVPLKIISNETGIERDEVERMLERLKGKVEYKDGWVCIVNFIKHQNKENSSIKIGIKKKIDELPKNIQEWVISLREEPSGVREVDDSSTSPDKGKERKGNKKIYTARKRASAKKDTENTDTPTEPENPKDDDTPFSLQEYIEIMRKSPQKHIQIIAEYADEKKPDFTTKGQWRIFTSRNVRVARELSVYSLEQISEAFELMMKDVYSKKNKKGFITKWGLETIGKYLIEINQK